MTKLEKDNIRKQKNTATAKKWKEDNKEHSDAYHENYREVNREIARAKGKAKTAANNLNYHVVYALPNAYNDERVYCGMTQNTYNRMRGHQSSGRNTKGWFILDICGTAEDARIIEASYHAKGYAGKQGYNKSNKI